MGEAFSCLAFPRFETRATLIVLLLAVVSYLIGSIPFGLFTARVVRGIDIRTVGSGNIGATNVGREIGWKWGGCVLFLDALKGLIPTLLPIWATDFEGVGLTNTMVLCGIATAIGHMFPIYLGFKGGKGVATGLGVAAAVALWSTLAAFATFLVFVLALRWVSLASVLAATAFAIAQVVMLGQSLFAAESWPLTLFTFGVPLLIVIRHRSNLRRLMRGEEPKTFGAGSKKKISPADEPATAANEGDASVESAGG